MNRLIILTVSLIFSANLAFSQDVTNAITQIKYMGEVWEISSSETMDEYDWVHGNDEMADLLCLQLYTSTDDIGEYHYFNDDALNLANTPLLAIPFLSCGVGYDYYVMLESTDSFLLFEYYTSADFEGQKRVVVLNKIS